MIKIFLVQGHVHLVQINIDFRQKKKINNLDLEIIIWFLVFRIMENILIQIIPEMVLEYFLKLLET